MNLIEKIGEIVYTTLMVLRCNIFIYICWCYISITSFNVYKIYNGDFRMIKIADNYYELSLIDIIKELKRQTESYHLFNQIKELPEDVMVSCPFHKEGQERRASCGIRKSDGWVHCFTCGESCSLEQMISRCFNRHDLGQYGLTWLRDNFLVTANNERELKINLERKAPKQENNTFVSETELDGYRYYHPYMYKRKLTDEIIEKFDIGYDEKTNCITFPVRDKNGNCLFVARRSVVGKYFNYPNNVEKPVYGLYELPKDCKEIIICESMINALTCYVYGRPAVALNGTGTDYQIEQLKELNVRRFILALDPDNAGEKGTRKLKEALGKYKVITKLKIPKGKDVNDLSKAEFDLLEESFA